MDSVRSDGGGRPGRRLGSVRDVASMLGVSVRTAWRLLAAGDLPRVSVGRSVRVPLDAVEAFIQRGGCK